MVAIASLWMPILVSAVLVFLVSAVVHMLLPYHRSDYGKLPAEGEVMEAVGKFKIPPGDYMVPCAGGPEAMKSPEFAAKMNRGPVMILTVLKAGPASMGSNLIQWFLFCVVAGFFTAYVARLALPAGAGYRPVFRLVSCVAFMAYALAQGQDSIWYKRKWSTTLKNAFDGLIYGLVTGGTFGWLWPD